MTDAEVKQLEAAIDEMNEGLPKLRSFVLPGGCRLNPELHACRTILSVAYNVEGDLVSCRPWTLVTLARTGSPASTARIALMKNWKALAEAHSLGIPESGLDLITVPLDGLEQAFRKLATSFPADTDSAQIFEAWPEGK